MCHIDNQLLIFLMIRISYLGASIAVPINVPKSTISKENDSFNIFQDHFYNKLQRSKMLLKYTDELCCSAIALVFIPRHTIVAGYYGFTLDVRVSVRPSVLFPDDNLSKHQWIFTKLPMCIDIVEIWFGIANGQISSNFYRVTWPRHAHIFVSGW